MTDTSMDTIFGNVPCGTDCIAPSDCRYYGCKRQKTSPAYPDFCSGHCCCLTRKLNEIRYELERIKKLLSD